MFCATMLSSEWDPIPVLDSIVLDYQPFKLSLQFFDSSWSAWNTIMDVQRNAVLEISRLRLYQSNVEKCKRWACGSSVIFISLYFAPTSVMYDAHKAVLQIVILLMALCSVGFIYFFGKPTTALTRKQMKLLGVSEDDITYLAALTTPTPPVANASRCSQKLDIFPNTDHSSASLI